MNDLSYTQEYLLCALNPKGKIPVTNSSHIIACIVAGGLLELLQSRAISIGAKKKVVTERSLNENEAHLKPLYDTIKGGKPMTVKDIAGRYVFATNKRINEFIETLSFALKENNFVIARTGGLFHNKTLLIPDNNAVTRIIEKVRAEFLEEGNIQDETVVLGSLLQKSSLIKNFFSKFESQKLKTRLEEIKKSEAGSLVKEMVEYIDAIIAVIVVNASISH